MHPLAADQSGEAAKLPEIWETLLQNIYDGAVTAGDIDTDTAISIAESNMKAVTEGYGTTLEEVDYTTPDFEMLASMERNVWQFSAAKSYQVNKELSLLLKDGDHVREYTDWRREAVKLVDTWNNAYAQSEYTTILSTSQHNADYVRFKANEESMPLITRSGVHDAKECQICAVYDGLTAPIDDPCWSYAYGDLHFRDRCRMLQLASGEATPADKIPLPDAIPKIFRVNLAQKMLAVPPDHPYYDGVSKKKLNKWVDKNLPDA